MIKHKVDTLIISDIHLGFTLSRAAVLLERLHTYSFKRLILNGDIFEDLNFNRLHSEHWDLLSYFRKLTRTTEVVWIVGNHDGQATVLSRLLGIKVHNQYIWKEGNKKFLAIHGHQFDRFISRNPFISYAAGYAYYALRLIKPGNEAVSRWVRRHNRSWLRLSAEVAQGAVNYGRLYGAKVVTCGHTHKPMHKKFGNIEYYNSGSWVEKPSTLITILNGEVELVSVE